MESSAADKSPTQCLLALKWLAGPSLDIPAPKQSTWLLGRALDCDLILPNSGVSRHHAMLDLDSGLVEDLDSSGGTLVNGRPIKRQRLQAGDRIQIGPWTLVLTSAADASAGETIHRAGLATALAAPRLDLLLRFCEKINQADSDQQIYAALAEAAKGGSGCQRALIIDVTDPGFPMLAQSPALGDPIHASRQLIEASLSGGVIQLGELAVSEHSASVQAQHLVSATAVALTNDDGPYACLYLDARNEEAREQPETARFCQALVRMAELALARRRHQQALWQQREQIYADLHDDLGARLLNQVYRATDASSADEARAMLEDLRDVVSRPAAGTVALMDLLAELRAEAMRRLEQARVGLVWTPLALPDTLFWSNRAAALLSRSLRELLSNALRHAQPSRVSISIEAENGRLIITASHDGDFADPGSWQGGRGTRSLNERSRALGGEVSWTVKNEQLETRLDIALQPP